MHTLTNTHTHTRTRALRKHTHSNALRKDNSWLLSLILHNAGQLLALFTADQAHTALMWDFLAILAANGTEVQKNDLYLELK